MAEFDISPESLKAITEDFSDLAEEQRQAAAARALAAEEAQAAAAERMALTAERQRQVATTAAEQSVTLDEMSSAVSRMEEIRKSPFLRIIEPVAGAVSEKFSREKLAESVVADQRSLSISNARDQLNASVLQQKDAAIQARLDAVSAKAQAESGDVVDLATQIQHGHQARTSIASMREQLLVTADDKQLPELVEAGVISQRQAESQANARKSERLQVQNAAFANEMAAIRSQNAKVEMATDAQLADNKFVASLGVPAQMVVQEKQRRSAQMASWESIRLANKSAQRADAMRQILDKDLKALAEGKAENPDVSQVDAQEELAIRQNRQATAASSMARAERDQLMAEQNAKVRWVSTASVPQLRDAIAKDASGKGVVTIEGPDGMSMQMQTKDLRAQLNLMITSEAEQTVTGATGQAAARVAGKSLDEVYLASGLPVVPGADLDTQLRVLIESNTLDAPEMEAAEKARLQFKAANETPNAEVKFKLQQQAAEELKAVNESVINRATEGQPASSRAAAKRMLTNGGVVKKNVDAITLITTSVGADVQTTSASYNSAISALRTNALTTDFGGKGRSDTDRATALAQEFSQKELSPADRIAASSLDAAVQHDMGVPIVSDIAVNSYAEAADALGNSQLAAAIRKGTIFREEGVVSETDLIGAIIANPDLGFTVDDYIAKLREVVPAVAERVTKPGGDFEAQTAIASINKLLFNNNITQYAQNLVSDRFEAAVGAHERASRPGTIGTLESNLTLPKLPAVGTGRVTIPQGFSRPGPGAQ